MSEDPTRLFYDTVAEWLPGVDGMPFDEAGRLLGMLVEVGFEIRLAHGSPAATQEARRVIETHERGSRRYEWVAPTTPPPSMEKGHWKDVGPLPRPYCSGDDHDGANGGPWPCDAVKLARLILDEPEAGGSDEADAT